MFWHVPRPCILGQPSAFYKPSAPTYLTALQGYLSVPNPFPGDLSLLLPALGVMLPSVAAAALAGMVGPQLHTAVLHTAVLHLHVF